MMWRLCGALLFIAAIPAAAQTLQVGEVQSQAGIASSGYIKIGTDDDGIDIPVSVIQGQNDGPVLALIAGTHGYEYPPVTALQRVRQGLEPMSLSGTLIIVHIANPPSFYGRTIYYSPADGKNLNRAFPGDPDGSASERIAHAITTQVIEQSDYVIDLHAGDGNEALRPYVYMPVTGNAELDRKSRGLAEAFGLDHIVIDSRPLSAPEESTYSDMTALSRGIPAVTTETGQIGSNDDKWVTMAERGVWNVLRHLGMLPGPATVNDGIVWLSDYQVIPSPITGVFRASVRDGYSVSEGTIIGQLLDPFGATVATVRSPFAGVVNYVIATPPINAGEPLAMVSRLADPPE